MYNRYIQSQEAGDFAYCFDQPKAQRGFSLTGGNILGALKSLIPDKLDTADLILILILVLLLLEDEDEEILIILAVMLLGR